MSRARPLTENCKSSAVWSASPDERRRTHAASRMSGSVDDGTAATTEDTAADAPADAADRPTPARRKKSALAIAVIAAAAAAARRLPRVSVALAVTAEAVAAEAVACHRAAVIDGPTVDVDVDDRPVVVSA